ncbi:MAG TPA: HEAT repeat domain-containing protein [Roseiflexaceae bacterium]|nr:HEAT repeat domain-containing protein [Roseiflexaceae bacterium]HMP40362.1 HEAT repeat domain-containing protein [Roseiflexaceae bacterium]
MFNRDEWRRQIIERFDGFARNPRQELQLAGTSSLLTYLVAQTLTPFWGAFQREPIAAVMTLADVTRGPGADQIVQLASRLRYHSALQIERELRGSMYLRVAVEDLLIEMQTSSIARQRLNSIRDEWFRSALERDLEPYGAEFARFRRALLNPGGQERADALRKMRSRDGRYSPNDLALIHESLSDSSAHVRAAAARLLGASVAELPPVLSRMLVQVALRDYDAETRFAAARAVGTLRDHLTSPQLLAELEISLSNADSFVRSATALLLGQLGDSAGTPSLIAGLVQLLDDGDAYTREAAARALGRIGRPAALAEVLAALSRAAQDGDVQVHEAATDSLLILREFAAARLVPRTSAAA